MNKDNLSMVEKVGVLVSNVGKFFDLMPNGGGSLNDFTIVGGSKLYLEDKAVFYTHDELKHLLNGNQYITESELENIYRIKPCYFIRDDVLFENEEPEHTREITKEQYDDIVNLIHKTLDLVAEISDYYDDIEELYLHFGFDIEEQINQLYEESDKYRREYNNYLLKEKLDRELVEKINNQKKLNKI